MFCVNVDTEPPLTGEKLPPGSNTSGARLDMSARGLYSPLIRHLYIYIIVFNSIAKSNREKKPY